MTIKPNLYLFIGLFFLLLTWLFVGVFRDDEFYEPVLFTKYRPTFKVNFHSLIGMQSLELKDLSIDDQKEEIAFREFVTEQNLQNNSFPKLWFMPEILIQLTLTFLTLGIVKMKRRLLYKKWQLPAHFIICLLLTTIGLVFILVFENLILSLLLGLLILKINYYILMFLTRERKTEKGFDSAQPDKNK